MMKKVEKIILHYLYCACLYCNAHFVSTKLEEKIKYGFLMGAYLQLKPFLSIECIDLQKQTRKKM